MKKIGQMVRMGKWTVRPGNADEFIQAWQTSVEWLIMDHPGGGEAFLLQDLESPNNFTSFALTTMPEKTEELLGRTEFQEFMTRALELCDEIQPHKLRAVGYSMSR